MTYQRPIMREALFIHKKQTSHLLKRLLRTRLLPLTAPSVVVLWFKATHVGKGTSKTPGHLPSPRSQA